ncbi:MAG: FAD-binding oxidoreductase [Sandaracinaceae bacterium]
MVRRQWLKWAAGAAMVGCGPEPSRAEPGTVAAPTAQPAAVPPTPVALPTRAREGVAVRPADEAAWTALGEALDGRLVRPNQSDYGRARLLFDPRFDHLRPDGIVYASTESDVQRCVAFSREHALRFAARCGGHSYGGYSGGPGLVCDVGPMARVEHREGRAGIGAGAKLIDIYATLAASGASIPGGSCPSVGIAGLTLGGGQGVLGRKLGLTSDAMRSVRLVTASGDLRTCSAEENSDLFWACQGGGGGNFGVATEFHLEAHPVAQLVRFAMPWSWSAAADVIAAWQEWGPDAPDELWSKCEIGARADSTSIAVHGVFMGTESDLRPHLDRLVTRVGARPRRRSVETAPLLESMLALGGCARRTLEQCHLPPEGTMHRGIHLSRSHVIGTPLSSAGIARFVERMPRVGLAEGRGRVGFDALGGAIARVAPDASAFVHRRARFVAQYASYWSRNASAAHVAQSTAWLDRLHEAMAPHAAGAYVNYIDPRLEGWAEAYYGANLARLRRIKASVDPESVFRFAQGLVG